jgi:hypothetical protein
MKKKKKCFSLPSLYFFFFFFSGLFVPLALLKNSSMDSVYNFSTDALILRSLLQDLSILHLTVYSDLEDFPTASLENEVSLVTLSLSISPHIVLPFADVRESIQFDLFGSL